MYQIEELLIIINTETSGSIVYVQLTPTKLLFVFITIRVTKILVA